ncbi:hypothetical protein B7P43_G00883, partial [Cryptotermes secundus]
MWNPGSTSYADILRGRQVSEGNEETTFVTELRESNISTTEKNDVNGRKVQESYGDKYNYQQEDWSLPDSHKTMANFQQTEEVFAPAADEIPTQTIEDYGMDQTSEMGDVVEKIAPNEVVDTGTFLEEEVIPSVHEHDVSGVTVPPAVFEYIQQPPPDLVGFIASGQQLLNSGLGTYHTSAHQYVMSHDGDQSLVYPVTVTAAQQPGSQYETLTLDYVQPSIDSVAYPTPVHQDFVPQQYDLSQQAVLSDPDITLSPEVTPIHDARQSKKIRSGHHSQTEMMTFISTSVVDEEIKPVTVHKIESDHQAGSTDGVQTEGDKCQLSYAQILAQGLCSKPLQPSSQAVNMSVNRNDRIQSSRPTSPVTSYSRELSASPSRDISSTVREEVTESIVAADRINAPKLDRRAIKKKKDKVKKEVDGLMQVHSPPSGDQQKHKSGKNKQRKKDTVHTNFEFNGKQELVEENREQVPVVQTGAAAVANIGEPLTVTSGKRSVADNSLASVKDRKDGCKKSKLLGDVEQQNVHSKPVSQISPQSNEPMEMKKDDAPEEIPEQLEVTDDKQGALLDQEKKKRQKKKKLGKNVGEDEIEKALKEIAMMEMTCSKHKNKNNELPQEAKVEVTKPDKEDKKCKKLKSLTHIDNASALIHEAEPKQMATVVSSFETATLIQSSDCQGNITELKEKQNKNPEILPGIVCEQEDVNVDIPKIEHLKKKKKRGKKSIGCKDNKHIVGELRMQNRECEIDDIETGQDVLCTQKSEPFAKKQHEVIEAGNIVEEPVVVEQGVSEHFPEGIITAEDESTGYSQFGHAEIASEEAYIPPPDLLADIELGTELLKSSRFISGMDSDIPADVDCKQKETDPSIRKKGRELRDTSSPVLNKGKRGIKKQKIGAKLPREEVNKIDGTSVMVEKSHNIIKSVPQEEQLKSESKPSHLAPIVIEDKTDTLQKGKIHLQLKKTDGPESPIKGKKSRKAAKKGISKQCESPHNPKQEPVGADETSGLYRQGGRDDLGSDNDISGK